MCDTNVICDCLTALQQSNKRLSIYLKNATDLFSTFINILCSFIMIFNNTSATSIATADMPALTIPDDILYTLKNLFQQTCSITIEQCICSDVYNENCAGVYTIDDRGEMLYYIKTYLISSILECKLEPLNVCSNVTYLNPKTNMLEKITFDDIVFKTTNPIVTYLDLQQYIVIYTALIEFFQELIGVIM